MERTGAVRGDGRLGTAGGTLASLAAAAGLLVGVRAVVALEPPGIRPLLRLPALSREPMGMSWTSRVVWPDQLQDAALERIAGLVAAMALAAASVALLNALVLLLESSTARRRELAVRAAVGAGPRALVTLLLRDVRRLGATALSLGTLLGLAAGGALRGAWPGFAEAVGGASAVASAVPALLLLALIAAWAYVRTGLAVARRTPLAGLLAAGGRATADRGEAFLRRALSAVQMGIAGGVALGTLALGLALHGSPAVTDAGGDTVAVSVEAPGDGGGVAWSKMLRRLASIPGLRAESLSTPGALEGLGVRDYATAQCGACFAGGMPMPFWGVRADHHAVGPGFFRASGIRVTEGRGITFGDVAGSRPVAVVNRTFADEAFEGGEPLGHRVRLGSAMDGWYEVVGVVEDPVRIAVGGDDLARPAVWVSALQGGMSRGDVLLRGSDRAVAAAVAALRVGGYRPGEPRTLSEARRRAAAPLLWTARLAFALGLLTLALALHGGHVTALQITRRRVRELAVRRVLGATDRRLMAHAVGGSLRAALWGGALAVLLGSTVVALVRQAVGGVPALGPGAYAGVVGLLAAGGLLASVRAVREALAVAPARAVE